MRDPLSPWLGEAESYDARHAQFTLRYEVDSEPTGAPPIRLKIEIDTREHFAVEGFRFQPFEVGPAWFQGETDIQTYEFDKLLATKPRTLYQRKNSRGPSCRSRPRHPHTLILSSFLRLAGGHRLRHVPTAAAIGYSCPLPAL